MCVLICVSSYCYVCVRIVLILCIYVRYLEGVASMADALASVYYMMLCAHCYICVRILLLCTTKIAGISRASRRWPTRSPQRQYICLHTATCIRMLLLYPYYISRYLEGVAAVPDAPATRCMCSHTPTAIYVSAYYGMSRYLEGVASMAGHEKKIFKNMSGVLVLLYLACFRTSAYLDKISKRPHATIVPLLYVRIAPAY
jgi:hypothetical protein